jgi:C_GCAxxG_C_C family probable redox protein
MAPKDLACARFEEGFSCSQAVFSAYAEQFGLDRETALKIAGGFGGGMGRMAQTCGAVTGAFMAIGLKYGAIESDDQEAKDKAYDLVREFADRFKLRHGSIICQELLGCDISKPEGLNAARDQGLFKTICPRLVRDAAEMLEEILAE